MDDYRSVAEIDLGAITHNYRLLLQATKKTPVMAVVKANAYGHGDIAVSRHLEAIGAPFFGVVSLKEALALRGAGITKPILCFGAVAPTEAQRLKQERIIATITSLENARAFSHQAPGLLCHLKVDTGMARFGLDLRTEANLGQVIAEIRAISEIPGLAIGGIYTHFAEADKPDSGYTESQFTRFALLLAALAGEGINLPLRHCANSAATLAHPQMHLDMVRAGLGIYGLPHARTSLPFRPALTLKARVVEKHQLRAGESVSYGRTYRAAKEMEIATIAIGYADGYPRLASNRDYLLHGEAILPVIGTVCMDALMVDVTGTDVAVGDFVEVFGARKTATALAETVQTIDYEILTSLGERIERVYHRR